MRMALWHSHSNSRERMFSMTYSIEGLCPDRFASLFALDDAALAALNARRVTATADRGFPCRISLQDAGAGEELILLPHPSHDVAPPYRSAYAIYVRPGVAAARYRETGRAPCRGRVGQYGEIP